MVDPIHLGDLGSVVDNILPGCCSQITKTIHVSYQVGDDPVLWLDFKQLGYLIHSGIPRCAKLSIVIDVLASGIIFILSF